VIIGIVNTQEGIISPYNLKSWVLQTAFNGCSRCPPPLHCSTFGGVITYMLQCLPLRDPLSRRILLSLSLDLELPYMAQHGFLSPTLALVSPLGSTLSVAITNRSCVSTSSIDVLDLPPPSLQRSLSRSRMLALPLRACSLAPRLFEHGLRRRPPSTGAPP
jgi:hypothetical protein